MDRALWPSNVPDLFRVAASALTENHGEATGPHGGPSRPAGEDDLLSDLGAALRAMTSGGSGSGPRSGAVDPAQEAVAERLRRALGVPQFLSLTDDTLAQAVRTMRGEVDTTDLVALAVVEVVGHQLLHQYPMSSLIWDGVNDELAEVFADADLRKVAPGVWNRAVGEYRTVVIQMIEEVLPHPDVRRFTLHWGLTMPSVPFCRHGSASGAPAVHQLSCCAVSGDLGSVRAPFGSHRFVVTLGMVLEQRASRATRLVGREGFRARLHRLVNFCNRVAEREQLLELLADHPWRNGIGVAEQLRNADPQRLDQLLR